MLLSALLPTNGFARDTTKSGKPAPSAQALYESGIKAMRRGYNTKALEYFVRVRNYHRDDPLSVKAQLAIADLYFKQSDFEQARFAYEEFATYHPRHQDLDYVTWRIGLSVFRRSSKFAGRDQTSTRGAVNVWTGFDRRFPDSKHREEVATHLSRALERLASKELFIARFYADRKAWGSVAGRAEFLLKRYPDTSRAPEAMYWLGRSLHAWGEADQARSVHSQLATAYAGSPLIGRLDRALNKPAGERPEERVFIRPYRIRGDDGQAF